MEQRSFIWKYIYKYKWRYFLGILTLFAVDYLNLYIPQFTGEITDGLRSGSFGMEGVIRLILGIIIVGGLLTVGRFVWRIFIFGTARKIEYEIRDTMFAKLETLSPRFFNENKTGDLMAHFINDLQALRVAVGPAIITSFDAIVMTVMVVTKMISHVSFSLTLLACIPMVFIAVGGYYFGEEFEKRFGRKQKAFADLSDSVQESISGERVIKAFVQEEKEMEAFQVINTMNKEKNLDVVKLHAIVIPLLDIVIGISYAITIVYGGYLAICGEITLGRFVAFNQYLGMLVWPMLAMGESITSFSQGRAAIARINEIFNEESDIQEASDVLDIQSLEGAIAFQNLSFKYKDNLPYALQNITLQIGKGETLGILGRTGSGKTTLISVLLRLYNTQRGMITIDGVNLEQIPLHTLRNQIAIVPQDNFLFSDLLKNNIAFGEPDTPQETIEAACEAACVHDNIIEFPDGYNTRVGERGVTLSGGQKQRSSIARALLKDAPILILDDALSAVDTDTEEKILNNLRKLRAGKTTIIIAHRISTLALSDHIAVLDNGSLVEYGTHDELMEVQGIYKDMFEKQQLEMQLERVGDIQ